VPGQRASAFLSSLDENGASGDVVGEVVEGHGVRVTS
jgi:hypothetical protein